MIADWGTWLAILGITASGLLTRASFVVFGVRLTLPPLLEQALRFAPAAVLGAIVAPALVLHGGQTDFSAGNYRLFAALVASLIVWRTKSMIWSIAGGMATLTLLRLYA